MKYPTFKEERALRDLGFTIIAGVDEVGVACLAGPVVAAAVVLPLNSRLRMIRDSKTLSLSQREILYDQIVAKASGWAIGSATPEEIDQLNIRRASILAMERAVRQIGQVEFVLVDAWTLPNIPLPQRGIVKGDVYVKSIAAASIVAKVTRDRMMLAYAEDYPEYGFERHKGYPTSLHREQLFTHGPCPIHRRSFLKNVRARL